jgi:hypothetical protein
MIYFYTVKSQTLGAYKVGSSNQNKIRSMAEQFFGKGATIGECTLSEFLENPNNVLLGAEYV